MSLTGPAEGEPYKVGVAIADITTGLFAATAILAALHERLQSGRGQAIDVALLDAQVAWLANVGQNYLSTGVTPARYGNAHPSIVPYETFPTCDGAIAVAIGTDEQYRTDSGLTLPEGRWQQAARLSEQALPVWEEPAVQTEAVGPTLPHPGLQAWSVDASGHRVDLRL